MIELASAEAAELSKLAEGVYRFSTTISSASGEITRTYRMTVTK